MKKIGNITFYLNNYGAFLQAFALQKTLEKCGYYSELINYDYLNDHCILKIPISEIKQPLKFIKRLLVSIIRLPTSIKTDAIYKKSVKKNLKVSDIKFKTYKNITKFPPEYDLLLIGSDQVFNPNIYPYGYKFRLALFSNGKKASYAASCGDICFSRDSRELLLNSLYDFSSISIREPSLCNYIHSETGICVSRHIDPTLLLSSSDWDDFSVDYPNPLNEYILYYQIGEDFGLKRAASSLSDELNLPIFTADRFAKFENQIKRDHILSPEEFVYVVKNASYVVTNSYHCAIFSIIFKKKALIILPLNGKARINDLIDEYSLSRLLDKKVISDSELNHLYDNAINKIEEQRLESINYLKGLI